MEDEQKKPKPVNLDDIDLDKMKLKVTDVPSILEYAHTVGGFSIVPTEQGQIKAHAQEVMREQTQEQLSMIYEQMKTLAKQAQDIQKRVVISDLIYNSEIAFTPVVGKIYFLYEQKENKRFLSLVSPEEWGARMKDMVFIAEVRLNADHTWKIIRSSIELSSDVKKQED